MAAHERYGKISPPAWESRFQHPDEQCRLELSHELSDPAARTAHGMLVDTETYIDCPYRYWPVARCPVEGRCSYGLASGCWDRFSAIEVGRAL
jgi:hypothetical protein